MKITKKYPWLIINYLEDTQEKGALLNTLLTNVENEFVQH